MIRRLGCAPGGDCCSACRLGDTAAAAVMPDGSGSGSAWTTIALMIAAGFGLAYVASGKAKHS